MFASRFLPTTHLAPWTAAGATTSVSPNPVEAKALAILESSTDVHEKARACQELAATTAGPAAVPALTALLADEHLSDYARSALESIADPAAAQALRNALTTLEGRRLAGVVNSIGARRDQGAVAELRALAFDPKRGVAAEAVASLGMIGTNDSARVLEKILVDGPADLRAPAAHAALVAAQLLIRQGQAGAADRLLDVIAHSNPPRHVLAASQTLAAALRQRR